MLTVRPLIAGRLKTISCSFSLPLPPPSLPLSLSGGMEIPSAVSAARLLEPPRQCHPYPERRWGTFPPECWISFRFYLGSWRAYWREATVGTRPQRHVIVILFFLLSWTRRASPPRARSLPLSVCRTLPSVPPARALALRLSPSLSAGTRKLLPILPTVCSPHDAHSSFLSSFLRAFFLFPLAVAE